MFFKTAGRWVLLLVVVISFLFILGVVRSNAQIKISDEVRKGSQRNESGEPAIRLTQIKVKDEVGKGSRSEDEEDEDEDEDEEDAEGVLIKDIHFVLPQRPPTSGESKALKERRRQIMAMVEAERNRLKSGEPFTQDFIKEHIKWLEKNLAKIDKSLAEFEKVEGPLIPRETLKKLTQEYMNKELTLEDMNLLADIVTMAYQEKGYVLVRVSIPEQEIKDGILQIAILEGDIGEIKISGQKYYKDRVIRRQFEQQKRHGAVREDLLERGLLLTKDVPATETRVLLKRGKEEGTVDLQLETEDRFPFSWSFDFNNFGSEAVGKNRFGTHIGITEPFWGSTFSYRGVQGTDREKSALDLFDLSIPVGGYGTKTDFYYLKSDYAVGQEFSDLGLTGPTRFYGGSINHPLKRTRDSNLNLSFAYDYKKTMNFQENEISSIDKIDVFTLGFDYDALDRYLGKNIMSFSWSAGHHGGDDLIPKGRSNVDLNYDRFNLSLARIQKIYGPLNIMLRGSGQYSEDRLSPIETFIIGGYGTVRGHEVSVFLGDSGYTFTAELLSAPPYIGDKVLFGQKLAQMVQLALFIDNGAVYVSKPEPGETDSEYLTGYGGGIRLYYKDIGQFKFDIAWPTKDKLADTAIGGQKNKYYYFLFNLNLFPNLFK